MMTGRRPTALLVTAAVLTAFNLRTAVSSVGAVLPDVQHGLGISAGLAGILTALPVLSFAVISPVAPALARRYTLQSVMIAGIIAMTVGMAVRPLTASPGLFFTFSLLAYIGCALVNVLLPSFVRTYFPTDVRRVTAWYSTALAIGVASASVFTVPVSDAAAATNWRLGLLVWGVPAAAALVVTLMAFRRHRPLPRDAPTPVAIDHRSRQASLFTNPGAWATAIYFGTQGLQSYVAISWLPRFFRDSGSSATSSGALVGVLLAIAIPLSLALPSLAGRTRSILPLVLVLAGFYLAGYLGLFLAPLAHPWIWVVFVGIGAGAFPLVLTTIGTWSAHARETATFSAFVQSVGYLIAIPGPLGVGLIYQAGAGPRGLITVLLIAWLLHVTAGTVMARSFSARRTHSPSPALV